MHRWDATSYNVRNIYQHQNEPVAENTVLKMDPDKGVILNKWGAGQFYMPHGATVDAFNNLWLTDVAMHQVCARYEAILFKFIYDFLNKWIPVPKISEIFETLIKKTNMKLL